MFLRRVPRSKAQHLREFIWPSMGLKRLSRYYKHRLGRMRGTPAFIAKGMANGVAISFTPFIGFHMATGLFLCWVTRGSVIAMALATLMSGNFWTFPFIWIATYKLGQLMLGHTWTAVHGGGGVPNHFTFSSLTHKPMEFLVPMTLGCIPFCIVFWVFTYFVCEQVIIRYKAARKRHLEERRAARHHHKPGGGA